MRAKCGPPGGREGWTLRDHRAILRSEPYVRADLGAASDVGQRLRFGQGTQWRVEGEFGEDERPFRAGYGYRLESGLTLTTEASRRESANDDAPEYALMLRASMRW